MSAFAFALHSIFSTTVLLNVTRKGREWRIEELVMVRHAPLERLTHAIRDMRAVLKSDERVLKALHRRVFLNRITPDGYEIIISAYVEAANRDQFMAVKEDLLQVLMQILARNSIRLASSARTVEILAPPGGGAAGEAVAAAAAAALAAVAGAADAAPAKGEKGDGKGGKEKGKPPFSFGW